MDEPLLPDETFSDIEEDTGQKSEYELLTSQINAHAQRTDDKLDKMIAFMTETITQVKETKTKVQQLEKQTVETTLSIKVAEQRISDIEDTTVTNQREIAERFESLEKQNAKLIAKINQLEHRQDVQHTALIRNEDRYLYTHFLLEGVQEQINENTCDVLIGILKLIDEKAHPGIIDTVFRQNSTRKPRPIHFSFTQYSHAEFTIRNKFKLNKRYNNQTTNTPIYINQLASIQTQQQNADFRLVMRAAKESNITLKLRQNHVIYMGKPYFYKDLCHLPSSIATQITKTVIKPKSLGFRSTRAPLSNLYPCTFEINGIVFNSSEQAIHYHRSLLLKDIHTSEYILKLQDPIEIMRISKHLTGKIWDAHKNNILYTVLLEKFGQNPALAEYLQCTEHLHLVECTLDPIWGGGISLQSKELESLKLPGTNLTGHCLMMVRSELRNKGTHTTVKQSMPLSLKYEIKSLVSQIKQTCLPQPTEDGQQVTITILPDKLTFNKISFSELLETGKTTTVPNAHEQVVIGENEPNPQGSVVETQAVDINTSPIEQTEPVTSSDRSDQANLPRPQLEEHEDTETNLLLLRKKRSNQAKITKISAPKGPTCSKMDGNAHCENEARQLLFINQDISKHALKNKKLTTKSKVPSTQFSIETPTHIDEDDYLHLSQNPTNRKHSTQTNLSNTNVITTTNCERTKTLRSQINPNQ